MFQKGMRGRLKNKKRMRKRRLRRWLTELMGGRIQLVVAVVVTVWIMLVGPPLDVFDTANYNPSIQVD